MLHCVNHAIVYVVLVFGVWFNFLNVYEQKCNVYMHLIGDSNNHAHMEGYQVSNQCMALVRDNCLLPTIDVPELAYVRESSNEQYVPDVFYKVCIFRYTIRIYIVKSLM